MFCDDIGVNPRIDAIYFGDCVFCRQKSTANVHRVSGIEGFGWVILDRSDGAKISGIANKHIDPTEGINCCLYIQRYIFSNWVIGGKKQQVF